MERLKVLAPTRYPWQFNGPRHTHHDISRRNFVPMNKIWPRFEAVTVFNPIPPKRFDFIHAFNRIPLEPAPFIIGFESHLPRAYGLEKTRYFRFLSQVLASKKCRRIIAISEHARRILRFQQSETGLIGQIEPKLGKRFPNIEIPAFEDHMANKPIIPFRLCFIGNHFGRKGGCVAVRMAEKAIEKSIPLEVTIVSTLEAGPGIWTDPERREFFDPYLSLLSLPSVRHFEKLPNWQVQSLLGNSHLSILTTFSDTFGYSAIESMANWTPVLATRQSALPEFITNNENGILLDLPVTELGDWVHSGSANRDTEAFERNYADEIERMAEEGLDAICGLIEAPEKLAALRSAARQTAIDNFCSRSASEYWNRLYQLIAEKKETWPNDSP